MAALFSFLHRIAARFVYGFYMQKKPHKYYVRYCTDIGLWYARTGFSVLLIPNMEIFMATNIHIDQIDTITIQPVDAAGNPVAGVVYDSPPVWTNSNPAAATNVVSADGTSNVVTPVASAIGQTTTIGVTAIVSGVTFTASNDYTIIAGSVAGIRLVDTFSAQAVRVTSP